MSLALFPRKANLKGHHRRGGGHIHDHDFSRRRRKTRVQGWAKEWSLGSVNSRPAARGSQEAGFTQPRDQSFAHTCKVATFRRRSSIVVERMILSLSPSSRASRCFPTRSGFFIQRATFGMSTPTDGERRYDYDRFLNLKFGQRPRFTFSRCRTSSFFT